MAISIGRRGRVYVAKEEAYGVVPALTPQALTGVLMGSEDVATRQQAAAWLATMKSRK